MRQHERKDEMTSKTIKILRQKLKLTQSEMANLLKVTLRTIQRWEGMDNIIPQKYWAKLEKLDFRPPPTRRLRRSSIELTYKLLEEFNKFKNKIDRLVHDENKKEQEFFNISKEDNYRIER